MLPTVLCSTDGTSWLFCFSWHDKGGKIQGAKFGQKVLVSENYSPTGRSQIRGTKSGEQNPENGLGTRKSKHRGAESGQRIWKSEIQKPEGKILGAKSGQRIWNSEIRTQGSKVRGKGGKIRATDLELGNPNTKGQNSGNGFGTRKSKHPPSQYREPSNTSVVQVKKRTRLGKAGRWPWTVCNLCAVSG